MIFQVIGTFIAVVTSSIAFRVPKRFLVFSGMTGAVGQFVYLMVVELGLNVVIAAFIGTLTVAVVSHSLARLSKAPVTIFLVPGIIPMVPGLGMYRSVYFFIEGNRPQSIYYMVETLQFAGMIALAIFIVDSIFRIFQKSK